MVNENSDNLIISPLISRVTLAMAAYGADGTTATQMRSALFMPSDDRIGLSGYNSLMKFLNHPKGVELRLANKMYMSTRVSISSAYKESIATKFSSSIVEVDFSDAQGAVDIINSGCEKEANGRIKNVITSGSLDSNTTMVLVNAVYFKGEWERKFDPSLTKNWHFYVDETVILRVPIMTIKKNLRLGELPELDARFIEIPYRGREISMIIIKPNKINGLTTVIDNIHKFNPSHSLQLDCYKDNTTSVILYLPKFKTTQTFDLQEPLEKLGMTDMFKQNANFCGISATPLQNISKVVFIEVDEEGTEVATEYGPTFTDCEANVQH